MLNGGQKKYIKNYVIFYNVSVVVNFFFFFLRPSCVRYYVINSIPLIIWIRFFIETKSYEIISNSDSAQPHRGKKKKNRFTGSVLFRSQWDGRIRRGWFFFFFTDVVLILYKLCLSGFFFF